MFILSLKINCELFEVFGTKELIISYPQCEHGNETGKRIRSFLQKYCMENTKDWDDHLSAIAFAFNLIHSVCTNNILSRVNWSWLFFSTRVSKYTHNLSSSSLPF